MSTKTEPTVEVLKRLSNNDDSPDEIAEVVDKIRVTYMTPAKAMGVLPLLKMSLEEAYGADSHSNLITQFIADIQQETMQVWGVFSRRKHRTALLGFCTTRILDETRYGRRLFIETLNAYAHISDDAWVNGFDTILKFAQENDCTRIDFETANPRIDEIAEKIGFNPRSRLWSFDLSNGKRRRQQQSE